MDCAERLTILVSLAVRPSDNGFGCSVVLQRPITCVFSLNRLHTEDGAFDLNF